MTIADGANITSKNGYLGYLDGSAGSAEVRGAGKSWTTTGTLYVGYFGSGSLTIADGATVTSTNGNVAAYRRAKASAGSVLVTGPGSVWNIGSSLKMASHASLTVADGGIVNTPAMYASRATLAGNGTINVTGGLITDLPTEFNATTGGTAQTLSFGNGGTLNLSLCRPRSGHREWAFSRLPAGSRLPTRMGMLATRRVPQRRPR